ncbi:tail fiber assembly protein [Pantoea agglomerans]|uniref:tail fiber assembly protein n=1 Tax=Enterobacter agglomerans TaxID=549 RepID=UPI00320A5F77
MQKKQAELLNEAVVITQLWQVQLMLDIISDSDKLKLKGWMKYIQLLQGVDVENPLEILWPDRPV